MCPNIFDSIALCDRLVSDRCMTSDECLRSLCALTTKTRLRKTQVMEYLLKTRGRAEWYLIAFVMCFTIPAMLTADCSKSRSAVVTNQDAQMDNQFTEKITCENSALVVIVELNTANDGLGNPTDQRGKISQLDARNAPTGNLLVRKEIATTALGQMSQASTGSIVINTTSVLNLMSQANTGPMAVVNIDYATPEVAEVNGLTADINFARDLVGSIEDAVGWQDNQTTTDVVSDTNLFAVEMSENFGELKSDGDMWSDRTGQRADLAHPLLCFETDQLLSVENKRSSADANYIVQSANTISAHPLGDNHVNPVLIQAIDS